MFAEKWWWIIKLKLEFSYLRFFFNAEGCSWWEQEQEKLWFMKPKCKKKKPEMQLWWQMGKKIKKNNN